MELAIRSRRVRKKRILLLLLTMTLILILRKWKRQWISSGVPGAEGAVYLFGRKNDSVSFLDSCPDHSRNCRGNLEYGALL